MLESARKDIDEITLCVQDLSLKDQGADHTPLNYMRAPFKKYIFPILNYRDLVCFTRANQEYWKLGKDIREARFLPFMEAIVKGDQATAEAFLQKDPTLLLGSMGQVQEHTGKVIQHETPFQAALLRDDIDMAEMMKPYFEQIRDGKALMQAQAKAIFPGGIEAHRQVQEKNAFDFSGIMQAIIDEKNKNVIHKALDDPRNLDINHELHKALNDYRLRFEKISLTENAFNIYHFIKALEQYRKYFSKTGDWNKRDLICRQVVGWTQRYFSACWTQVLRQGGYNNDVLGQPLVRRGDLRDDDLGYTSVRGPVSSFLMPTVDVLLFFSKVISGKNNRYYKLISNPRQETRCVIC